VSDSAYASIRIVLRPDRRQGEDRRGQHRGGRRASDQTAFALSSGADADEMWEVADGEWQAPHKAYVH
jgi:hypothetical protein